jgi:hypothetical protein
MAAIIPISSDANKSEEVADFMLFMLKEDRLEVPKLGLPQILAAKVRPGLSAELLASSITSRFDEIGIPSGPLEDGSPNVMEAFVKVVAEAIVDAIQNDMRVDVAVDTGVTIQANGANSGGPVVSVGSSIAPHTGTGVAR